MGVHFIARTNCNVDTGAMETRGEEEKSVEMMAAKAVEGTGRLKPDFWKCGAVRHTTTESYNKESAQRFVQREVSDDRIDKEWFHLRDYERYHL